jgi:uncharacterized ferritin-like protein (DUF455 family)
MYPKMRNKFVIAGDDNGVRILDKNYHEEIGHVRLGLKWFKYLCEREGKEPLQEFYQLSHIYFKGKLKPPFNIEGRLQAGMTEEWYLPLA